MDQSDTIGKLELIPLSLLSSVGTNWKNDIHKFLQQFEWLSSHKWQFLIQL